MLVLAVAIVRGIRSSRTGRVLIAVRENSRAAQTYGVNATVAKLTAFAMSGFIAAMAGAVFVHHQQAARHLAVLGRPEPEAFTMIVIGGLGSIPGAFLGAFLIKGLGYFCSIFPSAIRPYLTFFTTGSACSRAAARARRLLAALLQPPGPGAAGRRRPSSGLIVPSLVADMRATTTTADDGAHGGRPAATSGGRRAGPRRCDGGAAAGLGDDEGERPTNATGVSRFRPSVVTGGAAIAPLLVLFGLNLVDELDRTAFAMLVPNIRDAFGLDNQGILSVIALRSAPCSSDCSRPDRLLADRSQPTPRSPSAAAWRSSSSRSSPGCRRSVLDARHRPQRHGDRPAVVDPTHNSLLADYYPPEHRTKVYSIHRAANAVGAFIGPLVGGMLAGWFGWRVPFLVFVIPTVRLSCSSPSRAAEPVRGRWERQAAGADRRGRVTPRSRRRRSPRLAHRAQGRRPCGASGGRCRSSPPRSSASSSSPPSTTSRSSGSTSAQRGCARRPSPSRSSSSASSIGARIATQLFARRPGLVLRFLAVVGIVSGVFAGAVRLSPTLSAGVVFNCVDLGVLGVARPGHPRHAVAGHPAAGPGRSASRSASLWVIPGLLILPLDRLDRRHLASAAACW